MERMVSRRERSSALFCGFGGLLWWAQSCGHDSEGTGLWGLLAVREPRHLQAVLEG